MMGGADHSDGEQTPTMMGQTPMMGRQISMIGGKTPMMGGGPQ